MDSTIKWESFMKSQDMIWTKAPLKWEEGAFMGNGCLGTLVYWKRNSNSLVLELGRSDVYDNRCQDAKGMDMMYEMPRLPIGSFQLDISGTMTRFEMRLDLYHAIVKGTITTDCGVVSFSVYVQGEKDVIVVQTEDRGEEVSRWKYTPALSQSPRQSYAIHHHDEKRNRGTYQPNPEAEIRKQDGISHAVQTLSYDAGFVTSWTQGNQQTKRTLLIQVQISNDVESLVSCAEEQMNQIRLLEREHSGELFLSHCRWWEAYYQQSFVSLPDKRMERFYWAQMYKAASATRRGSVVLDNQGPWLVETAWPGTWWNLNVQLAYSPLYTANRLSISESLPNQLKKHEQELIQNVPEEYQNDSAAIHTITGSSFRSPVPPMGSKEVGEDYGEYGNLTWALHNCYRYYRVTMNTEFLREFLYPMLRRSISYYLHFLVLEEDGRYHLPMSASPEYRTSCSDCNYDLSLLIWGLQTLIESVNRLQLREKLLKNWKEILKKLTDYPQDEDGFYIGRDVKYSRSHRHYSHLLMIYPLYLVNPDNGGRAIMERSLAHWQSMPEELLGYSCTGAASICATLGDGDRALQYLERLWNTFLQPNTMYRESGPVIETPLAAAQTIQELLLQSWGNKVRIFPAVPTSWKQVSFQSLLAEGGFEVSGVFHNGKTQWVSIRSLAGEPLTVVTDACCLILPPGSSCKTLREEACGQWIVSGLTPGETILFAASYAAVQDYPLKTCDGLFHENYRYGLL